MLIHRYWTGDSEPPLDPWVGACIRSLNPDLQLHDWRDSTLPFSIPDHLSTQVMPDHWVIHKSNYVRLALLEKFGGWWYDYDVIPFLPVHSLPFPVIASHGSICNSFMGFPPGDPYIQEALLQIESKPACPYPAGIVSGSVFLSHILPPDIHRIEYPFSPIGSLLHHDRPFAVHLSMTNGI